MQLLENKVAIVTGAGQGIGRAIAESYAQNGARVVVGDINSEKAQKVADAINTGGERCAMAQAFDVSNEGQVEEVVQKTVQEFGRLDVMVNNAAILKAHLIVDFPLKEWQDVFRVNMEGTFLCSRAAARQMIKQGQSGAIVNTSSAAALRVDPHMVAYNSSKMGLTALTKTAALEAAPYGIRVNSVLPGPIQNTLLWQYLTDTTPGASDELVQDLPLRRIGYPEDVVGAVLWLCSDAASFITGQLLSVDGGLTVH